MVQVSYPTGANGFPDELSSAEPETKVHFAEEIELFQLSGQDGTETSDIGHFEAQTHTKMEGSFSLLSLDRRGLR